MLLNPAYSPARAIRRNKAPESLSCTSDGLVTHLCGDLLKSLEPMSLSFLLVHCGLGLTEYSCPESWRSCGFGSIGPVPSYTLQQVIDGVDMGECPLRAQDVCLGGNWVVLTRLLGPP